MTEQSAALYVHFPYCVSICPYCDFDRQATGFASIPRYVDAVATEIAGQRRRPIHSVFFGGGTPSLMGPEQVERLLSAARQSLDVLPGCEISLEANPGECSPERLAGFRMAGVDRLSIGVQSLHDPTLALLGRRHSAEEARTAYRAAREGGFDNVNLDLMLGLPGMEVSGWLETLDGAIELGPEHLSCYILTVDERVPMGRDVASGRLRLPDDDAVAEQYEATAARLAGAGYERYEVSNWARPAWACRHNLTYWRDEPFIGVGAGAAGWLDGVRTKNTPSPRRYMASIAAGAVERVEAERPTRLTQAEDFLALGLRLREGIEPRQFEARFGMSLSEALGDVTEQLIQAGCLESVADRLRIAEGSVLVTNELLLRLHEALAQGVPYAGDEPTRSGDASLQPSAEQQQVALPI
ncbi:MAG: radical SAM family heme chaperone HemW [Chloroflexi bacterium]|nr:radical SAM family heme chaperone HemW [Chloroflexota bacterium]